MRPPRQLDPNTLGEHVDRLYRAAWAICGSREQAEDLVQDTFVRVLGRRRFLHSENDLGYLLRTLRNTYLDQRRSDLRRPQLEPLDEAESPVQDELAAIEARAVYAAISALPAGCRDALVAVDVLGLSYREAARALRTRESTITSRLYRARSQVARTLRGEQVEPAVMHARLERIGAAGTPARKLQQRALTHASPAQHAGVTAAQPGDDRTPVDLQQVEHRALLRDPRSARS
jgi:RNA polymerase sigma-70 factor (ECF subfamily)